MKTSDCGNISTKAWPGCNVVILDIHLAVLRNVIVLGYMLQSPKSTSFSQWCYFVIVDGVSLRAGWNGFAGCSLEILGI